MPTIGRYMLLEKLGQGGMGVVYRAEDPLLQRIVAVKVISAPIEEDAERRERFFREARSAGQLSHKNIVTIHDLGEHDGQPYLAMESFTGQDLAARMADPARMSLRRKLEVACEICEGLGYDARPRRDSPRHQAGQHLRDRRDGEAGGLRARPPRQFGADPQQRHDRHDQLHVARAGPRGARRPSRRHLSRPASCSTSS